MRTFEQDWKLFTNKLITQINETYQGDIAGDTSCAQMGQNSKVKKTTVNPAKCEAKTKACHPSPWFAEIEECKACKRKF